eukprot:3383991-Prymnesium_polylepis.1
MEGGFLKPVHESAQNPFTPAKSIEASRRTGHGSKWGQQSFEQSGHLPKLMPNAMCAAAHARG